MSNLFAHGYALLIGVGQSANPRFSLPVTVKDIQALQSILTDPNFCGYPNNDHHIRLLHDARATRSAIFEGLSWLQEQVAADSQATVIVYYSGHGWIDKSTGKYYLIAHDIKPSDIQNSALCAEAFTNAVHQIQAKRLLVIIDSVHAAKILADRDKSAIQLSSEQQAVFASCEEKQMSFCRSDGVMSIYTYHLLEALQGAGNKPGDEVVRLSNLMNYLTKAVPESTHQQYQTEQTPVFDLATEDFAIALLAGGRGLPTTGKQAVDYYQNCLATRQRIGDRQGEANTLVNLSKAYASLEQYQQALECLEQATQVTTILESDYEKTLLLYDVSQALLQIENFDRALATAKLIPDEQKRLEAITRAVKEIRRLESNLAEELLTSLRNDSDARVRQLAWRNTLVRDALVIGINRYPFLKESPTSKAKNLKTPASDAEAIAQMLEQYGDFQVQRLPATYQDGKMQVDPQKVVTIKDLQKAITELFQPSGQQIPETAVLFFSGHGLRRIQGDYSEGYLGTSDANPRKDVWGISLQWLRQLLHESPVRQQIIWLDCPHSGEFFNFGETDLGEYKKGRDYCFIAASRDFQDAYEAADGSHGVLTSALLQGLDPTRQPDRWVTNYSLVDFVNQTLKYAPPQHPICANSGGQIILTGQQSVISSICPYKGLAYFDFNEEDPQYFYGRTALIKQLLERVRQSNFLAVLGASGSGKSSVVRAGLLYQLKLGRRLSSSDRWKIWAFQPGEHPLQSLALTFLEPGLSVVERASQLVKARDLIGAGSVGLEHLIAATDAPRVVLVVDQFEEVFTLCRDKAERQQFLECLLGALKRIGNKLCLVLVMRADFLNECSEYAELNNKIQEHLVIVPPMTHEELWQAIVEPARQLGLEIEPQLVNQIIADVQDSPISLPLMQSTLTELWQHRSRNQLTLSAYAELGGAIQERTSEIYALLSIATNEPPLEASITYDVWLNVAQTIVPVGGELEVSVHQNPPSTDHNNTYLLAIPREEAVGSELNIMLTAPGFQLDGDNTASLPLDPNTSQITQTVCFRLTALRPGTPTITAELYRGDTFETNLATRVQVTGFDESSFTGTRITTQPRPVPQPDFILRIQTAWNDTNSACTFQYQIRSFRFPSLFPGETNYHSESFSSSWIEQMRGVLGTTLEHISDALPEDGRSRLTSLGQYLFQHLLPTELQTDFRTLIPRDRTFTLLILADQDTSLPWELLHDGQRFLSDRFIIGRWFWELNDTRPHEFPVGAINVAHYADVEQPQLWTALLEPPGSPPPLPLPEGVLGNLDSTEAMRGLHLIRYSQSSDAANRRNAPVTLDDTNNAQDIERQMRPAKLNLRRNRPLVSLGYVRRNRPELTTLEQTWASAFIRAGCSAFTGSLWAVDPTVEAAFISGFYNRLWTGDSLGEAFHASRQLARAVAPDSLDWLAYVLFGDPMARPYRPVEGKGYAVVEPIGREIDEPLPPGVPVRFRLSLRRTPPVWHEERVIEVAQNLTFENLQAHVKTFGLQVTPDSVIAMSLAPTGNYLGWFTLVAPPEMAGNSALVQVFLMDGMLPIHSLMFSLTIENEEGSSA